MMIVKDEEVYQLNDLIVYELPETPSESITNIRDWAIIGRRSQCHAKEMVHIILGTDCKRDGSDIAEIINHEILHALILLLHEHRLGTSFDYYWYKWQPEPPKKMVSLLSGFAFSGIGIP